MSQPESLVDLLEGEIRAYFTHLRDQRSAAKEGESPEFASASHIAAAIKLAFRKDGESDDNPFQQAANRAKVMAQTSAPPPAEGLPAPIHDDER